LGMSRNRKTQGWTHLAQGRLTRGEKGDSHRCKPTDPGGETCSDKIDGGLLGLTHRGGSPQKQHRSVVNKRTAVQAPTGNRLNTPFAAKSCPNRKNADVDEPLARGMQRNHAGGKKWGVIEKGGPRLQGLSTRT